MAVSWEYVVSGEVDKRASSRRTLLLSDVTPFPILDLPGEVERILVSDFASQPTELAFDFVLMALTKPLKAIDEILLQLRIPEVLNKGAVVMQVALGRDVSPVHLPLIHFKYAVPFDSADYQVLIQGKE